MPVALSRSSSSLGPDSETRVSHALKEHPTTGWILQLPGSGTGTSTTSTRKFGPLSSTQPALHVLGMIRVSTSAMIVISTRYPSRLRDVGSR
jgi:hypothetical protein